MTKSNEAIKLKVLLQMKRLKSIINASILPKSAQLPSVILKLRSKAEARFSNLTYCQSCVFRAT